MILEILYTLIIAAVAYILVTYCIHLMHLKDYPPGPWPLPIIGNLHLLGSKPHIVLTKLREKYGPVMSFSFGSQRMVVIQDIMRAKETLGTKEFSGRPQDDLAGHLASRGHKNIAFSDYSSRLIAMRKIAHGALKAYGDGLVKLEKSVQEEVDALVKRFDLKNGEGFDPNTDFGLSVTNVICAIIFGRRYSIDHSEFQCIRHSINMIFSFDFTAPVNYLPILTLFPNSSLDAFKRGLELKDNFLDKVLKEHKESFDPEHLRDFTDFILSELKKLELEDESAQHLVDDINLQQILSDLLVAGVETTTTMLTWSTAYLARYPEVQSRIAEERKKVLGDRMPRLSDRGSLHYFEAVIQESLRMGTVAALAIPHKTIHNTECNGYKIPAGTKVWYNVWSMHHDETKWREPYCFMPQRFLDSEGKLMRTTDQSFLPFGSGRRVCIGEALARMELFMFLSNILYRYELVPDSDLPRLDGEDGELGLVFKPKPFKIKLNRH